MKIEKLAQSAYWLYGIHPCLMALENTHRTIIKACVLPKTLNSFLSESIKARKVPLQVVDKKWFETTLTRDAVHQGVALSILPLPPIPLTILEENTNSKQRIIILDQVHDPHNIGAILRSAAVFAAEGVIITDKNAPHESAVLAKAACGALEKLPLIRTPNLAQALTYLKEIGFWCYGFAETATQTLHELDFNGKVALVLGAEGDGMRRLTKDLCDFLVRFKTHPDFSTLNVSNAAAIALHHVFSVQMAN